MRSEFSSDLHYIGPHLYGSSHSNQDNTYGTICQLIHSDLATGYEPGCVRWHDFHAIRSITKCRDSSSCDLAVVLAEQEVQARN